MSNILYKADQIVNHRAEEKERQYGPFNESIERTAQFYNLMKPKNDPEISPEGVLRVLIALKLSREAYGHKEDNLLDGVAYIGALNNYIDDKETTVVPVSGDLKFICEMNNIGKIGTDEKNIKT
jgi:hypothetical protein